MADPPAQRISAQAAAIRDKCRKSFFHISLDRFGACGTYPPRQTITDALLGYGGIDVKDSTHWLHHLETASRRCRLELFPAVAMGLTPVMIVGNDAHNDAVMSDVYAGRLPPVLTRWQMGRWDIKPLAVSYKHGSDEQLEMGRLAQGVKALKFFLASGTRFVLWLDFVAAKRREDVPAPAAKTSWLKRGLLPYQLFYVLCLDNSTSGRDLDDYKNSFWLNIEGVLATLGSGMIMVGKQLRANAVNSWNFGEPHADIPVRTGLRMGDVEVAYRPGALMGVMNSLAVLLGAALKGAYDGSRARYNRDKDELISMGNCYLHSRGWEEFGRVAFDEAHSDYEALFEQLSRRTNQFAIKTPLKRTGRCFTSFSGEDVSLYPLRVVQERGVHSNVWRGDAEWLPLHCRGFMALGASLLFVVEDIWLHVYTQGVQTAAIGVAIMDVDGRDVMMHVKAVAIGEPSALAPTRVVDVWDGRVPGLVKEVFAAMDGGQLDVCGVRRFLKGCGLEVPAITSWRVCSGREISLGFLGMPAMEEGAEEVVSRVRVDGGGGGGGEGGDGVAGVSGVPAEEIGEDGVVRTNLSSETFTQVSRMMMRMKHVAEGRKR